MAASWFLIGGAMVLILGVIALCILIAIVTRRPGLAGIIGLACFLGIGVLLAMFLGFATSPMSGSHYSAINTYPPDSLAITNHHYSSSSYSSHTNSYFRAKLFAIPLLLVTAAVVAFVVAAVMRGVRRSTGNGGPTLWPALVAAPILLLLYLGFGFLNVRVTTQQRVSNGVEPVRQIFDHGQIDLSDRQGIAQAGHREAEAAMARAQRAMVAAQERTSGGRAAAGMAHGKVHVQPAAKVGSSRARLSDAQIQKLIATSDINDLIAIFTAPRIELNPAPLRGELKAESATLLPSPPAVPAAAQVITTAPPAAAVTTKGVVKQDVPAKEVLNSKLSDDARTSRTKADEKPAPVEVEKAAEKLADAKQHEAPSWIDDEPRMDNDDWLEVVVTDEYASEEDARRATEVLLLFKTAERVEMLTGGHALTTNRPSVTFSGSDIIANDTIIYSRYNPTVWYSRELYLLSRMGIGINEVRRSVIRDQYLASRESPRAFNTMYKQYTLAQFTPWFDDQLRRHYLSYKREQRFAEVGVGAGAVLGLLVLVFGLFKVDTWTKGYYTKRLFIGVPAVIIGGMLVLALIGSLA